MRLVLLPTSFITRRVMPTFFEQLNPRSNIITVVVEGAAADEVAVDDAGLVDEDAAADF